ncbi:hypothetical protein BG003_000824 [Podila horticola]|nr:hypothetical protein BG003_000824 [Podila horticola]
MNVKRPRALSIDTSKDGLICTRTKNDPSAPEETPTPPSCRLEKIYEEKLEILGVFGYENWFDDHANPFYRQHIQNISIPTTTTTTTTTTTVTTKNDTALAVGVETESQGKNPFKEEDAVPEVVEMDNIGTMSNDVLVFPLASTKTATINKCSKIEEEDEEEEFTGFEPLGSDTSSCCSAFGLGISFDQDDDDHHHHSRHNSSNSDSNESDEERDVFDSENSSDTRGLWNKTFRPVTPSPHSGNNPVTIEPSSTSSSHAFSTLTKALNLHRQQILTRRLSNRNRIMDRGHLLPDTTHPGGTFTLLSPPLPLAPRQAGIPFTSCGSKVRALSPYPRPFTRT